MGKFHIVGACSAAVIRAVAWPFVQVVVGAVVIAVGVTLGVTGWLGWRGVLRRNRFAGVRTAPTMASDQAFRVANRVAGPVLVAAGAVAVLGGSAVLVAPSGAAFAMLLTVVAAGVLGLTLAGGVLGSRAAAVARPAAAGRPASCAGSVCAGPTSGCTLSNRL